MIRTEGAANHCATVRRGACVLAALFLLASAGWVLGQAPPPSGPVVSDIVVTGNHNVSTQTILSTIKMRAGSPYSLSKLEEDVTRLYATGSFSSIRPHEHPAGDNKILIEYIVSEHPNLIRDVIIKNARHLKQDEVESLKNIRKNSPLNPELNKKAVFDVLDFYKSKGRYFANAVLEEGSNPADSRVVINVTEGPIVRVAAVYFTGNDSLASGPRLKTQIDSKTRFLGLPFMGVYNPAMADHDAAKLEEYYKDNGYQDVRVTREVVFNEGFGTVNLIYHIREGQRYHVKDVSINGAKNLPESQLQTAVKLQKGDIYNESVVTADMKNIGDMYGWRGYGVQTIKKLYWPETGLVEVRYEVVDDMKVPAKVGELIIVGNEVTKDRVIRRALGLYPNQLLQYPELRLGENNLARLGIFDNSDGNKPSVTVLDRGDDSEYKDVMVQVKEQPTGSLMFGVSVNSNAGLVGTITLNERNFDIFRPPLSLDDIFEGRARRGAGQEFRAEAVPGTVLQRYSVSFREPFLFDQPWSFGLSAYYFNRLYNEYTETRVGGRATLGHQFNRYWSVNGAMRVENVNVSNVPLTAPTAYTSVLGNNFLYAPRAAVTFDSRDSYLKPTEGTMVDVSLEEVLGKYMFPVFNAQGSQFFTTYQRTDGSGRHVLALRSQFAVEGSNAPVYERFFAGGFGTIRGFQFRGVGPFQEDPTTGIEYNVGGTFMFLNSAEYQVPIKANDQLYMVGFIDSGTVEQNVQFTNYRVSAGFGLRIVVPMMGPVPIALDFGFPIVRGPNDREQIFSFYVGAGR